MKDAQVVLVLPGKQPEAVFSMGELYVTRGAAEAFTSIEIAQTMDRHAQGDWGDLTKADKEANELALKGDSRLFSAYKFADGKKLWIITEADRSSTTVLLPTEY